MQRTMFLVIATLVLATGTVSADEGVLPVDDNGKPVNTDFETGDLRDWTQVSGSAFNGQPIKGDTVNARRPDMRSRHAGEYWVGTFEISEDGPRGIIQSRPFKVTHPWAKFLIGGFQRNRSARMFKPARIFIVAPQIIPNFEDCY